MQRDNLNEVYDGIIRVTITFTTMSGAYFDCGNRRNAVVNLAGIKVEMHTILEKYTERFAQTGHLPDQVAVFLRLHGFDHTASHCSQVAAKGVQLAQRFGVDAEAARYAGWLHDVSAVIPNAERLEIARILALDVLPEEIKLPMILHQKLSRVFASQIFDVQDAGILSAVECHTTLKSHASQLDKIIFVADKLAWDQNGTPPYQQALEQVLDDSLDAGVCIYLEYLWQQRDSLPVVHPWMVDALHELCR